MLYKWKLNLLLITLLVPLPLKQEYIEHMFHLSEVYCIVYTLQQLLPYSTSYILQCQSLQFKAINDIEAMLSIS